MNWRKWIRFSMWNLMWAAAAAAMLCAVMKYTMPGKRIVSAVLPLAFGIPFVSGSLVGGFRGMCYGFVLGVAIWILVTGVVLLLLGLGVDIGAI